MKFFRSKTPLDPFTEMETLRLRADRMAVLFLEEQAVNGTLTRDMVIKAARAVNRQPSELIAMIPDRRREERHIKALAGIRKAGLDEEFGDE